MTGSPLDMYTETLLDHARHPLHRGKIENADGHVEGFNPLCGDRVGVWIALRDGVIDRASFEGDGCALSIASASMLTDSIEGMNTDEVHRFIAQFLQAATDPLDAPPPEAIVAHPELASLTGVRRLPMRVKCVTMAWRAAAGAIDMATNKCDGEQHD